MNIANFVAGPTLDEVVGKLLQFCLKALKASGYCRRPEGREVQRAGGRKGGRPLPPYTLLSEHLFN